MAAVGQSNYSMFGGHLGFFYLMDFEAEIGSL
jgi:predicted DNA-binding protein with PD1-like motif